MSANATTLHDACLRNEIAQELELAQRMQEPDLVSLPEGKPIRPANAPLPQQNDPIFREGERFLLYGRKLQRKFNHSPGAHSKEKSVKLAVVLNELGLHTDAKLRFWAASGYTRANLANTPVRVVAYGEDCGQMTLMEVLKMDRHRFREKKNAALHDDEQPKLPKSYERVRRIVNPQFLVEDAIKFLDATKKRLGKYKDGNIKNELKIELINTLIAALRDLNRQGYEPIWTVEDLCRFKPRDAELNLLQILRTHRSNKDSSSKEAKSFIQFCEFFALEDLLGENIINEIAPPPVAVSAAHKGF